MRSFEKRIIVGPMSEIPVNLFICMYITIGDHIKEGDVIILDINNSMNYSVHNKIVDESYFEKKGKSYFLNSKKLYNWI